MNIVDLYSLKDKKKKLMNIDGYDKKKINNIIEEIDKKKTVTTSVFLGSLGIEGCSFKTFRNILKYISYDDLIDYCVNDITDDFHTLVDKIPGVKEVTASKIVKGIRENETTIIELEVLILMVYLRMMRLTIIISIVREIFFIPALDIRPLPETWKQNFLSIRLLVRIVSLMSQQWLKS